MLPEDSDWFDNSGNEPITHDWTNALQHSLDVVEGTGNTQTMPDATGTTIAWGGGKIIVAQTDAGWATGTVWEVDSTIDWRNRSIVVWGHAWNNVSGPTGLPGEGSEPASQPGGDWSWTPVWAYLKTTGATAGSPPANCTYLTLSANIYLFAKEGDGKLQLLNSTGNTMYAHLHVLALDQFPTRV